MEEKNKFKGMNLFIMGVLIVTIIALVTYIVITLSKNKNMAENTEQIGKTTEVQQIQNATKTENIRTMKDIAGTYKATSQDRIIELVLYSNGLFEYTDYTYAAKGILGNYYLSEDNIVLENLFNTYSDTSVTSTSGTIKLIINKDGIITDNRYPVDEQKTITINLIKTEEQAKELNLSERLSDTLSENVTNNSTREMTADERYTIYINGLKNKRAEFINNQRKQYSKYMDEIGEPGIVLWNEGHMYGINVMELDFQGNVNLHMKQGSEFYKKYGNDYKLATNMIDGGILSIGQDESILIYTIDTEGGFHYCTLLDFNSNLTLKETSKLKNIVRVLGCNDGGGNGVLAVDIDGNLYDVISIINK